MTTNVLEALDRAIRPTATTDPVVAKLREKADQARANVMRGRLDHDEYRYQCGRIQGLEDAIVLLQDHARRGT